MHYVGCVGTFTDGSLPFYRIIVCPDKAYSSDS